MIEIPDVRGLTAPSFMLNLGSRRMHMEAKLVGDQAIALRVLTAALDRQQAKTKSGERVVKPIHALRWLLDQVADLIGDPIELQVDVNVEPEGRAPDDSDETVVAVEGVVAENASEAIDDELESVVGSDKSTVGKINLNSAVVDPGGE